MSIRRFGWATVLTATTLIYITTGWQQVFAVLAVGVAGVGLVSLEVDHE